MYRIAVQLGIAYAGALGRAVFNAWRATAAGAGGTSGVVVPIAEARMILNVSESATPEEINAAFERMYEANSVDKGNSFYLQSKVFRAREALLAHAESHNDDADLDPPPPSVKDKQ